MDNMNIILAFHQESLFLLQGCTTNFVKKYEISKVKINDALNLPKLFDSRQRILLYLALML